MAYVVITSISLTWFLLTLIAVCFVLTATVTPKWLVAPTPHTIVSNLTDRAEVQRYESVGIDTRFGGAALKRWITTNALRFADACSWGGTASAARRSTWRDWRRTPPFIRRSGRWRRSSSAWGWSSSRALCSRRWSRSAASRCSARVCTISQGALKRSQVRSHGILNKSRGFATNAIKCISNADWMGIAAETNI